MNERIRELHNRACRLDMEQYPNAIPDGERIQQKFAELIIKECVDQCSQEWYDLNNSSKEELDDRGIAIRVGQKNGILKVQHRLKKHFGVDE